MSEYELEKETENLKELEKIANQFPNGEQINLALAKGFVHLITVLGCLGRTDDADDKLHELEKVALRFPESEKINLEFASGLVNLTFDLDRTGRIEDAEGKLKELEKVALRFPASEKINFEFTRGLFNHINLANEFFSNKADEIDIDQLKELEKVALRFPESEEINLRFAYGLVILITNLGSTGRIEDAEGKLKVLEKVALRFQTSELINLELANGLYILTNDLGDAGRIKEADDKLKELEKVALRFPKSEKIRNISLKGKDSMLRKISNNYIKYTLPMILEQKVNPEKVIKLHEKINVWISQRRLDDLIKVVSSIGEQEAVSPQPIASGSRGMTFRIGFHGELKEVLKDTLKAIREIGGKGSAQDVCGKTNRQMNIESSYLRELWVMGFILIRQRDGRIVYYSTPERAIVDILKQYNNKLTIDTLISNLSEYAHNQIIEREAMLAAIEMAKAMNLIKTEGDMVSLV